MGTTSGIIYAGSALFGAGRRAVLKLLFGHPEQRFYQRQVILAAGLGTGVVQRELAQLTGAGILTRTVEGRQTYFQANRHSPIFEELRGIVRKTFGVSEVLRDGLAQLSGRIELAFVFGSIAAGAEDADSDIDLMAIGELSLMEVVTALSDTQLELGREVNPVVYPAREFCRKLRDGQHFIKRVMAGPKIFLIGNEHQLKGLAQVRVAQGAQDQPRRDRGSSRRGRP